MGIEQPTTLSQQPEFISGLIYLKHPIGTHIRSLRERKTETLKEVASRAGVSESLLSQIERNKVSPAIETLFKITEALGIEPEVLFAEMSKEQHISIIKKKERIIFKKKGITFHQLSKTTNANSRNEIDAYMLEIPPGHSGESQTSNHPGQECGIIYAGTAEITFGKATYILEEGDSISFSSTVPHQIKNCGTQTLKAYWVTSPA